MAANWIPATAFILGMAAGPALAAYAGWIVRCRQGSSLREPLLYAPAAASLANGAGWLAAAALCRTAVQGVDLALAVSFAVVLTIVDNRIRIIPNELVAAFLAFSAAMALAEGGWAALPGRALGLVSALLLCLPVILMKKGEALGGGDVKLAAAVGFATGYPGALLSLLFMALAAVAVYAAGVSLHKIDKRSPIPLAGCLMAGMALTAALDRAGALGFIK